MKFFGFVLTLALIFWETVLLSTPQLIIFAAAGAKPVIDEINQKFKEKYQTEIEIRYAGGGEILNQMILSERGDIYIAPEQEFMKIAVQKKVVNPASIKTIAWMIPVIAVQKGNPKHISALSDLTNPGVRVAICRSETTLLGKYAKEIFQKVRLEKKIKKNIVAQSLRPDNILTMLMLGSIDAGIVWHFYHKMVPDKIEIIFLPPEQLTGVGKMQIAVSSYCKNKNIAHEYINFVTSSEEKIVFKKHGYFINEKEVKNYEKF